METIDQDEEIALTLRAIMELEESGDYGAMHLAEADLVYLKNKT